MVKIRSLPPEKTSLQHNAQSIVDIWMSSSRKTVPWPCLLNLLTRPPESLGKVALSPKRQNSSWAMMSDVSLMGGWADGLMDFSRNLMTVPVEELKRCELMRFQFSVSLFFRVRSIQFQTQHCVTEA